jgi:adenosine deaminase
VTISDQGLRQIPKVEFHRHLDGSVRFETLLELSKKHSIDLGVQSSGELFAKSKVLGPMKDLEAVLDAFWISQKVLSCYEAIKRVTYENIEDAFRDGVRLLELRFAPSFIKKNKPILNFDEVFEGVLDGVDQGEKKFNIPVGVIFIIPRGKFYSDHEESIQEFLRYQKKYPEKLVGIDLADIEPFEDIPNYTKYITKLRASGAKVTIHTGENTSAKHVLRSIKEYGPHRIGHGIKTIDDELAISEVLDRNIHLEICPTSNFLTQSVKSLEEHPFGKLFQRNISLSINSDDPHLMNIDLVSEYQVVQKYFGLGVDDFMKINKRSLEHSFLHQDQVSFAKKNYFKASI